MTARWRLVAPATSLVAAVLAGCVVMVLGGAPAHYAPINFAALALGLVLWVIVARHGFCVRRLFIWIAAIGLALTFFLGIEIAGVSRWLGRPPLAVHAGMLLLPAFCVLAARRFGWIALAATAATFLVLALQPDRGTAIAFLCAMAVVAWQIRTPSTWIAAGLAAFALAATSMQADPLAPVPFVESVLQDTWQTSIGTGAILTLALGAAIAAPMASGREGAALAAFAAGLTLASLLGPYPTPLIGYGAAPILGYALALGFILPKTPSSLPRTASGCRT